MKSRDISGDFYEGLFGIVSFNLVTFTVSEVLAF